MKIFLTLFFIFVSVLPAVSLSFDDAMNSPKPFVFYMYQEGCSACRYFDTIYNAVHKKYSSNFNFVKQNTDHPLSAKLIEKWNIEGVPFVLIVNPITKKASKIGPYCSMSFDCVDETLKSYK